MNFSAMPPPSSGGSLGTQQAALTQMMSFVRQQRQMKHLQPAEADPAIPPNLTLYVNNLDDRIKPDVLKADLVRLFSPFGNILEIMTMKSFWRRGQAWIVYDSQASATDALQSLQGRDYRGKPLRVNYSHERSDTFAKLNGTFVPRQHEGPKKPRAILVREKKLQEQLAAMQSQITDDGSPLKRQRVEPSLPGVLPSPMASFFSRQTEAKPPGSEEVAALLVDGIAEDTTETALRLLFRQFPGFRETRLLTGQRAAVKYDSLQQANAAMNALQNFNIKENCFLRISVAK